ncbi:hypothetical protein [Teredinibacter turnerae]|uniref:hypothetical protein n=1 Tax=Teredinibacter turnerae TaxID=2426 RepID=UPI0030CFC289
MLKQLKNVLDFIWLGLSHPMLHKNSRDLELIKVNLEEATRWCCVEFPGAVTLAHWVVTMEHPEQYEFSTGKRYCNADTIRKFLRDKNKNTIRVYTDVTNEMKQQLIGEFTYETEEPCPLCEYHLDTHYDDIECLCNGNEEKTYLHTRTVPWDTTKEIFKRAIRAQEVRQ